MNMADFFYITPFLQKIWVNLQKRSRILIFPPRKSVEISFSKCVCIIYLLLFCNNKKIWYLKPYTGAPEHMWTCDMSYHIL